MTNCRWLWDPPASGAWNMAVDEVLLESAEKVGPVLRFYMWSPPTLSLGYFQNLADRRLHPPSINCPVVRRPSGGGAILHDIELTYALVLPLPESLGRDNAELYLCVHKALAFALRQLGCKAELVGAASGCDGSGQKGHKTTEVGKEKSPHPGIAGGESVCGPQPVAPSAGEEVGCSARSQGESFMCFARRSFGDLVVAEHKIAGSAQRRVGNAILQHGSILLGRSPFAPEFPGLRELLGRSVAPEEVAEPFVNELGRALGLRFVADRLSDVELRRAQEILIGKHAHPSWIGKR